MRKGLPYEMILLGYKLIQQYIVTYPILAIPKPEQLNMSTKEQPHEKFSYSTILTSKNSYELMHKGIQMFMLASSNGAHLGFIRINFHYCLIISYPAEKSRMESSRIMFPDFYLQPGPMNHNTEQIFSFVDMLTNIVV